MSGLKIFRTAYQICTLPNIQTSCSVRRTYVDSNWSTELLLLIRRPINSKQCSSSIKYFSTKAAELEESLPNSEANRAEEDGKLRRSPNFSSRGQKARVSFLIGVLNVLKFVIE